MRGMNPLLYRTSLSVLVCANLGLMVCGCRQPERASDPEVVAEIDGVTVTRAQLLAAWQKRPRGGTNVPAATVLADLVDEAACYAQARRSGFLDQPETKAALQRWVAARYRDEKYREVAAAPEPVERELREAYAERTNSFVRPAALNLAVILHEVPMTATPEKRQEARQKVATWRADILAATNASLAFARTASAHSADPTTRYKRGDLGWLSQAELTARLGPEIVPACAALDPGGLSEPIEGPRGFNLVKLLGRRGAEVRPFAEVEPILRHRVREEKRLAAEAQLRSAIRGRLDIRTNLVVLQNLTLTNRPAATPPRGMPKG